MPTNAQLPGVLVDCYDNKYLGDRYKAALQAHGLQVYHYVADSEHTIHDSELYSCNYVLVLASIGPFSEITGLRDVMSVHLARLKFHPSQVVIVRATDCWVPPALSAYNFVDATELDFDSAIAKVANILGAPGPLHVFLSYAHTKKKNRTYARSLKHDLEHADIRVWIDFEKLRLGIPDWQQAIREGIANSDALIYVASEEAAASRNVRDELAIARDCGIDIYPFWASGEKWSSCAPLGEGSRQYVDGRGNRYDAAVKKILSALTKARDTV